SSSRRSSTRRCAMPALRSISSPIFPSKRRRRAPRTSFVETLDNSIRNIVKYAKYQQPGAGKTLASSATERAEAAESRLQSSGGMRPLDKVGAMPAAARRYRTQRGGFCPEVKWNRASPRLYAYDII